MFASGGATSESWPNSCSSRVGLSIYKEKNLDNLQKRKSEDGNTSGAWELEVIQRTKTEAFLNVTFHAHRGHQFLPAFKTFFYSEEAVTLTCDNNAQKK